MRAAYDAIRRGGTACIVGVGSWTRTCTFNAFELFFSEKNLMGSYYGSADVRTDFHRLLGLWKAGQLDLEGMITRRIKLDEINDAFAAMKRGRGHPPGHLLLSPPTAFLRANRSPWHPIRTQNRSVLTEQQRQEFARDGIAGAPARLLGRRRGPDAGRPVGRAPHAARHRAQRPLDVEGR